MVHNGLTLSCPHVTSGKVQAHHIRKLPQLGKNRTKLKATARPTINAA